jgi:DNA-binding MarR family transcriptional regulator/GNAT superfamily N-acetyltransferase
MDQIAQVRRFNRLVTQRVGALNDHYLARDRPLGEARLLFEIGPDGVDVRTLRARLDLDSGYLSRLLRSLETAGLITVTASDGDRRVRVARRTAAGVAEAAELEERSNALASSFLEPLNADQRDRLVRAMGEVGRLLTAGLVTVTQVDPDHDDAVYCRTAYFDELDRRFPDGHDPARGIPVDSDGLRPPAGLVLVAYLHGDPVGCGALRFLPGEPAHLKRMWVADAVRGLGIGRRLLAELEARAAEHGCAAVHLETHDSLSEAIGMYRAAGYVEVEPFNEEYFAHHWFEKKL